MLTIAQIKKDIITKPIVLTSFIKTTYGHNSCEICGYNYKDKSIYQHIEENHDPDTNNNPLVLEVFNERQTKLVKEFIKKALPIYWDLMKDDIHNTSENVKKTIDLEKFVKK